MRIFIAFAFLLLLGFNNSIAQSLPIKIHVDLNSLANKTIAVEVFAPPINTLTDTFVIPQIIPGTYMKINYIRNYSQVMCYDKDGNKLKFKQHKNTFIIKNAKALHRITYRVKQSFGGKKFWDNILACGGTIFSDSGFLLNYQLVTGYFKSHQYEPLQITVKHPSHLMASTSQKVITRSNLVDVFEVNNYEQLIDQPMMYHVPDTASFIVGGTRFNIAVHNKSNFHSADSLKPQLHKIMDSLLMFMGNFSMKEYHFLFYTVNNYKLGAITKAMLNAALEHRQSFVLTGVEVKDFQLIIPFLNYITAHEFLHTWSPLHIHSQKTEPYPFDNPMNLSAHLWMHEGITDYLAAQFCDNYSFTNRNNLSRHLQSALKQKPRSFSQSSKHIAESNVINWVSKIKQVGNAYSRGQVVGFCLDMELIKLTEGKQNLHRLMYKMANAYHYGKPFNEDSLFNILANLSMPDVEQFLKKYVHGKNLPPYQYYLNLLGWTYLPKKQKIPSFGKIKINYNYKTEQVYITQKTKNSIGLQKGDSIDAVQYRKIYQQLFWPLNSSDSLTLLVNRNGKFVHISGLPVYRKKNKYTYIHRSSKPNSQQAQFRNWYLNKRMAYPALQN